MAARRPQGHSKYETHAQARNKHPLGIQGQRGFVSQLETGCEGQVLRHLDAEAISLLG